MHSHAECRALRRCMEMHQTACSSVLDGPQSGAECALEVGSLPITKRLAADATADAPERYAWASGSRDLRCVSVGAQLPRAPFGGPVTPISLGAPRCRAWRG